MNTPSRCPQCRHVYPRFPYNTELSSPVSLLPAMLACASCPQLSTRKHYSILRGEERQWQWGSSPQVQLLVGGRCQQGSNSQGNRKLICRPAPTQGHVQSVNQPVSQSLVNALVGWASLCATGQGIFEMLKTERENKQCPEETPCNHRTTSIILSQGFCKHFTGSRMLLSS